MKLFLATDALDDVQWATARGWCDGVVLPDAALQNAASPSAAVSWLAAFARAVPVPVLVAAADALAHPATGWSRRAPSAGLPTTSCLQCPFTDANALAVRELTRLAASGSR